jgi:hypothetical protein
MTLFSVATRRLPCYRTAVTTTVSSIFKRSFASIGDSLPRYDKSKHSCAREERERERRNRRAVLSLSFSQINPIFLLTAIFFFCHKKLYNTPASNYILDFHPRSTTLLTLPRTNRFLLSVYPVRSHRLDLQSKSLITSPNKTN